MYERTIPTHAALAKVAEVYQEACDSLRRAAEHEKAGRIGGAQACRHAFLEFIDLANSRLSKAQITSRSAPETPPEAPPDHVEEVTF